MILPDVNVLIYSFRPDSRRHGEFRIWLQQIVDGPGAYGVSPQVLASLVRITTNRKAYATPSTLDEALAFCEAMLDPRHATVIQPGERHWDIYRDLCRSSGVTGTSHRTPGSPPLPSSTDASGSLPTRTTISSRACAGDVRSSSATPLGPRPATAL